MAIFFLFFSRPWAVFQGKVRPGKVGCKRGRVAPTDSCAAKEERG